MNKRYKSQVSEADLQADQRVLLAARLGNLALWGAGASIILSAVYAAQAHPVPLVLIFIFLFCMAPAAVSIVLNPLEARFTGFWFIAALALLVLAGSLFTVSPGRTIWRLMDMAAAAGVFLVVAVAGSRRLAGAVVCGSLLLAGLVVSIYGGNEYAGHARAGDWAWRVFSTFFNPGFLAGFLALAIPASLGVLIRANNRAAAMGVGFAVALQIVVLFLTGTRAGILAAGVAVGIFLIGGGLLRALRKADMVKIALAIIPALALVVFVGRPTSTRVQAAGAEGHSMEFRLYTWKGTAGMAESRPVFGYGPGSFEVSFAKHAIAGYTRLAHSNYLQAAAESGVPAAVGIFGFWLFLMGMGVLRLFTQAIPDACIPYYLAALGGGSAAAVRGVFDSDWWWLPLMLGASALAALLARADLVEEEKTVPASQRTITRAAAVIAAVACLVLVFISSRVYVAQASKQMAEEAEQAGRYPQALDYWRQSTKEFGWDAQARLRVVQLEASLEGRLKPEHLEGIARLERLEPTNPRIPRGLAELYMRFDREEDALEAFERTRVLDPKNPQIALSHARLLEKLGRKTEALEVWEDMLRVEASPYGSVRAMPQLIEPAYAWAHNAVADRAAAEGNTLEAREGWQQAEEILKDYLDSLKTLRPILQAAGLWSEETETNAKNLLAQVERKQQQLSL